MSAKFRSAMLIVAGLPMLAANAANNLVNHEPGGQLAAGFHGEARTSEDGRYVVFSGRSSNLDPSAREHDDDIWLRDLQTDQLQRLSVSTLGALADSDSNRPKISADGRRVLFFSYATNLIDGVVNNQAGSYIRDLDLGTTTKVLPGYAGGAQLAPGGHHVAFTSENGGAVFPGPTTTRYVAYLLDVDSAQYEVASPTVGGLEPNSQSRARQVSTDGRFVLVQSEATNLDSDVTVTGNGIWLFVYDAMLDTLTLATRDAAGAAVSGWDSSMSDDGRYVVFVGANGVYLRDLHSGTTTTLDAAVSMQFEHPLISGDGQRIAWHKYDIVGNSGLEGLWVLDRPTGIRFRVLNRQLSVDEIELSLDGSALLYSPGSEIRLFRPYTVSMSTTISASVASVVVGTQFTVTYTLTNLGAEALTNVGIAIDVGGDVLEPMSWDGVQFGAPIGNCGFSGFGDGECVATSIAAGETRTLTVTYLAEAAGTAQIAVTLSQSVNDLQTSDHNHSTTVSITKQSGGGAADLGLLLILGMLVAATMRRGQAPS
jgi:Tol biopolymer transport system component